MDPTTKKLAPEDLYVGQYVFTLEPIMPGEREHVQRYKISRILHVATERKSQELYVAWGRPCSGEHVSRMAYLLNISALYLDADAAQAALDYHLTAVKLIREMCKAERKKQQIADTEEEARQ